MTGRVLELHGDNTQDQRAKSIAHSWDQWYFNKQSWMDEHTELNRYITATDTTSTSNQTLPWKNNTTTPKLTQIRDNLHSNYLSALFPNDDWLRWEAYTPEDATKAKKQAIENYMGNKVRRGNFRQTMSQLLLDYIDYGNAFAVTEYVNKTTTDENGDESTIYKGPVVRRIHPFDIVFNPAAPSFEESPAIVRSIVGFGELELQAAESANPTEFMEQLQKAKALRKDLTSMSAADYRRYENYQVDGFGNYLEYLNSGYIEVLTFMGDFYNKDTGTLARNRKIQILDRSFTLVDEEIKNWNGRNIFHATWRKRTNNLWGMGPLDNLVGMQYRVDHLENLKADAMDLHVFPPLVIKGNVDEFDWGPMEEIHVDENGDVIPLRPDSSAIQVNFEIQSLMDKMELLAGAPREAMGQRTPGEKTAFEVQQLTAAAGRIFQEKVTTFEIELLESVLNSMLEQARRNLSTIDVVRSTNSDLGTAEFIKITKDDIAGDGILRPIGARHFSEQGIMMQNLTGLLGGPLGEKLYPHMSGIQLSALIEDSLGLERYKLFRPNIGVIEATETQGLAAQGQKNIMNQATVPE